MTYVIHIETQLSLPQKINKHVDSRKKNRSHNKPSAEQLSEIKKNGNGDIVLTISDSQDNMILSKRDHMEEKDFSESDYDSESDSAFEDDVIDEINNQIYKFFKMRTDICKNSSSYWQDIPLNSKQRISANVECHPCGKVMPRKLALDHYLSHLKGFYPFHCTLCGSGSKLKFRSWKPFENHFIKRHYDFYKEHSSACSECNKIVFIQKHFCGRDMNKPVPRKKPKIFKTSAILKEDLKKENHKIELSAWNYEIETSFLSSTAAELNNTIHEADSDLSQASDEVILTFDQF